jgi:hypothetical protein
MATVTANIYKNLSTVDCNPVSFYLLGNQFTTEETPIIFNNGFRLNTHACLSGCLSFKSNKKTSMFLTNLTKAQYIMTDNEKPKDIGFLTEIDSPLVEEDIIKSPLADEKLKVLKLEPVGNDFKWIVSETDKINQKDVYNFYFQPDNSVVIQSEDTQYLLTCLPQFNIDGSQKDESTLLFKPRIYPTLSSASLYVDAQRFDYALGENSITLYQINDVVGTIRFTFADLKDQSTNSSIVSSVGYLTSSSKFPKEASINFVSYDEAEPLKSDIKNSFLVKYEINPISDLSGLKIDLETANKEYSQNYLGIFPYQYFLQTDKGVSYPLLMHGLKNYQTPEYNYSFGQEYIQGQKGVRRVYENIYTGTNQDNGLDHAYLGFKSNTLQILFQPDIETPFFFTPSLDPENNRVSLSECGLIEDGAIAGEVPLGADRIFIKLQDYQELIPGLPQPQSIQRFSNNWLCSWLSGNTDGEKIWMDRYYNPAYYTMDQALSAKVMVYNDRFDPSLNYTFDSPSNMYLEPGVLYRFYHQGKKGRMNFVSYLSSSEILEIKNWNTSPLTDQSPLSGKGILYFNNPENLKGDHMVLDGTNHILFPATTRLLEPSQMTVAMWLKVDDWRDITGTQIFGNYYDSGFGFINDSSLTTPIITLIDNDKNKVYNLNYRFSNIAEYSLPENLIGDGKIIQRLSDFSYWIFDTRNVSGVKYDVNNDILIETKNVETAFTNLKLLSKIDQIEIDGKENLYIYDNTTKRYVVLNTYGEFVMLGTVSNETNRIEIDLNNNLISCFGEYSVIDNDNNIWEIVGGNLYKNKLIFGNIGRVQDMIFDAKNYLWILNGQDTVSKIDIRNNEVVFSYRVGLKATLPEDPCFDYNKKTRFIDFIRVPKDQNTNTCNPSVNDTEDRLVLVDLNYNNPTIYTMNESGEVVTKLNLIALTKNSNLKMLAFGGFTGYQYLRKFTTIKKQLSWKIKIANPNRQNSKLLILPYDITNLSSGWHHFSLTFDSVNGVARAYIDSILAHEEKFEDQVNQIFYDYRTSLLFGCQTIKNTTLNDVIQIDDGYKFKGRVADLRVYSTPLTRGEIEQIYFSSDFLGNDIPLLWNMRVGERNYIEQIKHWFKYQLPGSKSKYYNLNIHNLNVPNEVKILIENGIKNNLKKIAPAHTSLYKINWV